VTVGYGVATAILTAILVAIAIVDSRVFRIPDLLSLPLIALGLFFAALHSPTTALHHAIGAAVGYGLFAAIGAWYFRRTQIDGLGLGDAKLFAAAGAWVGWAGLPLVLLIASVCGLLFAVLPHNHRPGTTSRGIAFGPWLACALWVVWLIPAFSTEWADFFNLPVQS
jgi:leader peptidase (prepilin peptidase) / N-methyltransferase